MASHVFQCRCGTVRLEAEGSAITGVTCRCAHCVAASRAFVAMGGPRPADAEPGARAVLFRKDRVRLVEGADRLDQYRFQADAPTRRLWARCCDTPMLLDYEAGFWLSLYRERGDVGETEAPGRPPGLSFIARLMLAYAGTGFRTPSADPALRDLPAHLFAPEPQETTP